MKMDRNRAVKGCHVEQQLLVASAVVGSLMASECVAHRRSNMTVPSDAPQQIRTLESFGAVGDGRIDDTKSLREAFASAGNFCLDGHGRTYRVTGTVRATGNLCLRNATLIQSLGPVDTRPYIREDCPITPSPAAVVDCGDPVLSPAVAARIQNSLAVRTLFVRSADKATRLRVTLDHVKIDRGPYAEAGSRADSAGIWIEGAGRLDMNNVEITGRGKGYGLLVLRSEDVTVNNLWIHDIVWAPYRGDAPLVQDRVARIGWNSIPIHEFRAAGSEGAEVAKFYGVRIQEQVTCASFAQVRRVRIQQVRISRCMARFDTGDLPFQADGLDISRGSQDVLVRGAVIDSTWEAMDVVANGGGINGLRIENVTATNSFAFGLKLGYELRNAQLSRVRISKSGLAGVVVYGPVDGLAITDATIRNVGLITDSRGKTLRPWPPGNRAGFRIDDPESGEASGSPRNVVIDGAVVTSGQPGGYEYGVLNTANIASVQVRRFRAKGFSKREVQGPGSR